jgi:hypothetical protein
MSLMFLAAMMMAQAPVGTAQQPVAAAQAPVAKKQKPQQVCEYIEVTGSRSKHRVCRDAQGNLDLGPGVHSGSYGQDGQSSSVGGPASHR